MDIKDNAATEDVVLAIVRPGFISPVNGSVQNGYSMDNHLFSHQHSMNGVPTAEWTFLRPVGKWFTVLVTVWFWKSRNDPRF